jgi:hypothetical protein
MLVGTCDDLLCCAEVFRLMGGVALVDLFIYGSKDHNHKYLEGNMEIVGIQGW